METEGERWKAVFWCFVHKKDIKYCLYSTSLHNTDNKKKHTLFKIFPGTTQGLQFMLSEPSAASDLLTNVSHFES